MERSGRGCVGLYINRSIKMSNEHKRFWEILDEVEICMVTTADKGAMRARPMAAYIDKEARSIQFVTDGDSAKLMEINADSDICLSFADTGKMLFASVIGKATVSRNRALIHQMWGPYCDVFFGSDPATADVAVIEVHPDFAEYWDNDSSAVGMAVELARAYFSDDGPDLGLNAKLEM
jgi:general stress protein 26